MAGALVSFSTVINTDQKQWRELGLFQLTSYVPSWRKGGKGLKQKVERVIIK